MTEGERVKVVRKERGLTLEKFGERFGMSRSSISDIENGRRSLTAQTRLSICREFKVNETWLRTGEGEMFLQGDDAIIADVAERYHLSELDKEAFRLFLNLDDAGRRGLMTFLLSFVDKIFKNPVLYRQYRQAGGELSKLSQADIEAEVTAYRNELELLAKVQADEVKSTVKQSTNSNSIKAAKRKAPNEMTREDIIAELERQLDEEEETRNTSPVFGPGSSGTATA